MNTYKLSNISRKEFRDFLTRYGCECHTSEGGHEKWTKEGLARPITLQTHIDPIPEFIVKNTLRDLGISRKEFEELFFLKKKRF